MSERILKALMQLFALITNPQADGSRGRDVVALFLRQQLNSEKVEEYLKVFDSFIEQYRGKAGQEDTGKKKKTSVNSVKVLKICTQINSELTQKQKMVVLLRLVEYVNSEQKSSPEEMEFVSTVSETFNIDSQEFIRCLWFITHPVDVLPDSNDFLIISGAKIIDGKVHQIVTEGLSGQVRVMRAASVNMYFLRYLGDDEVYMNGQPILKNRSYIFNSGSSVKSKKMSAVYYSDIVAQFMKDSEQATLEFSVNNVCYKFPGGKTGIHDISFREETGKLIGIMGASGAGKSTILSILNGSIPPTNGNVTINGIDIHHDKKKAEGVIGYISQDDLLMEDLTVFQNLFYNAQLCFDGYSKFRITKMVIEMLKSLGLYEIRNMKVGSPLNKKISGGQRKRLNIALELIREPTVLFVDEPTSGLSSRDSENIMDLLKELTLKNKLVFVVIHQPSSDIFKMFDKLLILDTGGYPLFHGNPIDAVSYFKTETGQVNSDEVECESCGNVNPEQIFNTIETKVVDEYGQITENRKITPKEWNEKYTTKFKPEAVNTAKQYAEIPASYKVPSRISQIKVFVKRDVLSKLSNTQYLVINLLEAPLLAFILAYLVKYSSSEETSYVYYHNDNIPAYMFMCVVVALFIGLTVSAEEIIRDQKILKREAFLNLSRWSYLVSKVGIMFFLSSVQAISFILLGNWILEIKGMNLDYFMILFSSFCFANLLGLNISSSFNSAVTIYILIPFLIIPQLLLSGVIVKFDKLNPNFASHSTVPLAGEVMASRWAYEALAVNQFKSNKYEKQFFELNKKKSQADFKNNFWIGKLKGKIDFASSNLSNSSKKTYIEKDLKLVQDEIRDELKITGIRVPFNLLDSLDYSHFNESIALQTQSYFDLLRKYYQKQSNDAFNAVDKLNTQYSKTDEIKAEFVNMKIQYTNESLLELVTNKNDIDKMTERGGRLIQRIDPIYVDPYHSSVLRAQFFAPQKPFFGVYIDTFWANMLVIWLMTVMLMFTLYFDVLRKVIDFFGDLPSRFRK
jgi:ABC-type multidrug transport system ATPase subunit